MRLEDNVCSECLCGIFGDQNMEWLQADLLEDSERHLLGTTCPQNVIILSRRWYHQNIEKSEIKEEIRNRTWLQRSSEEFFRPICLSQWGLVSLKPLRKIFPSPLSPSLHLIRCTKAVLKPNPQKVSAAMFATLLLLDCSHEVRILDPFIHCM